MEPKDHEHIERKRREIAAIEGRHGYCAEAVNKAIAASNRAGRRIGRKEANAIHRLLKGRLAMPQYVVYYRDPEDRDFMLVAGPFKSERAAWEFGTEHPDTFGEFWTTELQQPIIRRG